MGQWKTQEKQNIILTLKLSIAHNDPMALYERVGMVTLVTHSSEEIATKKLLTYGHLIIPATRVGECILIWAGGGRRAQANAGEYRRKEVMHMLQDKV